MPGSSPLARGLPSRRRPIGLTVRIIPARAGFTPPTSSPPPSAGDHPRSRGVYVDVALRDGAHLWIIPARAGFTRVQGPPCSYNWDHPRSRGVYSPRAVFAVATAGSSPLARGLLRRVIRQRNACGIIPARAGFTLADPWNPNEPTLYQTPAAFTAVLGAAPPGRDSAVEFGAALSTAGRAGRNLAAAGLRPRFGHHPDRHRRVATTSG